MNLGEIPVFQTLRAKMQWLTARQAVLAENVANANTPGFGARDLKPLDFEKVLRAGGASASQRLAPIATDPAHAGMRTIRAGSGFDAIDAPGSQTTPTGNSVVLEEQMMKVGMTQADYVAATNLYRKAIGMVRIALGRPGG